MILKKLLIVIVTLFVTQVSAEFTSDTLISWMNKGAPFDLILVDLRGPSDNITAVIGNAYCKPYNLVWSDKEFVNALSKIGKEEHIAVYCRSGTRSFAAACTLNARGYVNVYDAGGFSNWTGPSMVISDTSFLADSLLPIPSIRSFSPVIDLNRVKKQKQVISVKTLFTDKIKKDGKYIQKAFITNGRIINTYRTAKGIYIIKRLYSQKSQLSTE